MNYNSIEEIFSAGITNMTVLRSNTKQDDGTDTITGVDWFTYNGSVASTIYASGNSFIGFGSSSEHLKVNRIDGAMYSLYREEGTLYDHYRFLKIRWDGYSAYYQTSSSYAVTYDVILWDTGDISLHMINIPTSSNIGTYTLTESSTYSYTVSTSSPDVTFKKTDSGFEVINSIITLQLPFESRYLIRSNNVVYTVIDNTLTQANITDLTSEAFLTHGIKNLPEFSLIANLIDPEILYWAETTEATMEGLTINGVPPLPYLVYYDAQTIPEGSVISNILAAASDDVLYSVTFDNGSTWKYYNNGWVTVSSDSEGMTSSIISKLTQEQLLEAFTSSNFQFRCTLPSKESFAGIMGINYV